MDAATIHKEGYRYLVAEKLADKWPMAGERTHTEQYSALIAAVEAAKKRGDVGELKARFAALIAYVSDGAAQPPWEPVRPPQALVAAQDAWRREVAIVCAQMEQTPWGRHLGKARRLAETGAVADMVDAWEVHGDHGTYQLDAADLQCSCPHGKFRKEPCAHRTAVEIVKRCLAGGVPQPPIAPEEDTMEAVMDEQTAPPTDEVATMAAPAGAAAPVATQVYQAIAHVAKKIARTGVPKERTVENRPRQTYRSVDDVMNVLGRYLAEEDLLIVPEVDAIELSEPKAGSYQAVAHMNFTFIHAPSGTSYTRRFVGMAMDQGGFSIQKAQTYAYKEFVLLAFCIPVEGMEEEGSARQDRASTAHATPPKAGRPVPDMAPPHVVTPAREWESRISTLLRDAGKSPGEIDEYFQNLRTKYGGDTAEAYAKRLPGVYNGIKGKLAADDAPKAEAW